MGGEEWSLEATELGYKRVGPDGVKSHLERGPILSEHFFRLSWHRNTTRS